MALTKVYTIEIDGKQAAATVGQLKTQVEQMEAEMENLTLGTKEADEAIRRLGQAKGALKELEDAVDALDPKEKAAAWLDFGNGVVGAFGVASVAAENFGLSSGKNAEEVQKKMMGIITVLQSVEAMQKALNSETQSALKAMLASAKAQVMSITGIGNGWTVAGVKAKLFGTTTRAALTATGIGILIVLLGTMIAYWDTITSKVTNLKNTFSKAFPQMGAFVDAVVYKLRDMANFLSFGLIDDGATAMVKKLDEQERKVTQRRFDARARLIAEEEAAGRATYALKQQQLADELKLLDKSADDYQKQLLDKQSQIRVLKAQHDKQLADDAAKAAKEAEEKRKQELEKQKQATEKARQLAAENYRKMRELSNRHLQEGAAKREEERKQRYETAKLLGANTASLLRVEIDNLVDQQEELKQQKKEFGSEYLAIQSQINEKEKAILDAWVEQGRVAMEGRQADQDAQLAKYDASMQLAITNMKLAGASEQDIARESIKMYQERLRKMQEMGLAGTQAFKDIELQIQETTASLEGNPTIMDKLFDLVFGKMSDAAKERVKESLRQMVESSLLIADSLMAEAGAKLDSQLAFVDDRLNEIEERKSEIEDQIQEVQQRVSDLESQVDEAKGARREALIQKIAKERLEEAKLTAEKKKTAAEEAKLAKQREEAEKKRQELEAKGRLITEASTVAANIKTAATAVQAGVEAVAGAAKLPFPASLPAIFAAVAAVGAAVLSAKKLASSIQQSKFEDGGLVQGPRHSEGGVPFTVKNSPHKFEMEGGEFIFSRKAVQAIGVQHLEAANRFRSFEPLRFGQYPSQRKFAEGGIVPGMGPNSSTSNNTFPAGTTAVLNEDLAAIKGVLERIEQHAARTADKELTLAIGNREAYLIDQASSAEKKDMNAGKLF
ncbi:hypothetical protein [Rufibacter immobilis]|uniref:hypothetical protein n=1 Tax=Rufibacter immobilis TaxID=1348778 RepID=UPI0035EA8F4E